MGKMIAAFEANRRISDGLYEEELGPYRTDDDRYKAADRLMERDRRIFEEGMALFVEHYRSLWD